MQQELIKRDDELSCLPHEHLVEDYKKLKMMKKKADQFANEARQTAQKVQQCRLLHHFSAGEEPGYEATTSYGQGQEIVLSPVI